jgi:hypothetical protein
MTVIATATDIPPFLRTATVEMLAHWNLHLLYELHKNDSYPEVSGEQTPLITYQQGLAFDGTERSIYRVSLPLAASWASSGLKIWRNTLPYVNGSIPASFKAD